MTAFLPILLSACNADPTGSTPVPTSTPAPSSDLPPPSLPRSPEAASARLEAMGLRASCEGGVMEDEISYACTATDGSRNIELSGVTSALPLDASQEGAAAQHVEDLWIEVRTTTLPQDTVDRAASARDLRTFCGLP